MGRVRKQRPVVGMRPLWTEVTRFSAVAGEIQLPELPPAVRGVQTEMFERPAVVSTVSDRQRMFSGRPRTLATTASIAARRERMNRYQRSRYDWIARVKKAAGCARCGYSALGPSLEFHHINDETKRFEIQGGNLRRKRASVYAEMRKCVLVCANCHREIHHGDADVTTLEPFDPDKYEPMPS